MVPTAELVKSEEFEESRADILHIWETEHPTVFVIEEERYLYESVMAMTVEQLFLGAELHSRMRRHLNFFPLDVERFFQCGEKQFAIDWMKPSVLKVPPRDHHGISKGSTGTTITPS